MTSVIDRAIAKALRDASADLKDLDVEVEVDLASHEDIETPREALYEAVYAVFRALPPRLARGTVLRIRTRDRAGGDIEIVWEADETVATPPMSRTADVLRGGPHGDIYALALIGLEAICRTRTEHIQVPARGRDGPVYHRRFMLLVPSLERAPGRYP